MLTKAVDLESSDDDISEIQAEIAHLSACDSDHVTRYYGSFVRGWRLWIVMEYLAGGSCLDLVRLGECLPIAFELIGTLDQSRNIYRSSDSNSLSRTAHRSAVPAQRGKDPSRYQSSKCSSISRRSCKAG